MFPRRYENGKARGVATGLPAMSLEEMRYVPWFQLAR